MNLINIIQVLVALTIFNVWLIRRNKPTPYRGGNAPSMEQEFLYYGLPKWSVGVVGFSKVALASLLIAGLWIPTLTLTASVGLGLFMLGALLMHIKVKDRFVQTAPSLLMLLLCLVIFASSQSKFALAVAAN